MSLLIRLRPQAVEDVEQVSVYLQGRHEGASARFPIAVRETLQRIAEMPTASSLAFPRSRRLGGVRSWSVGGFRNYLILHLIDGDFLRVVGVLHGARDLRKLLKRRI